MRRALLTCWLVTAAAACPDCTETEFGKACGPAEAEVQECDPGFRCQHFEELESDESGIAGFCASCTDDLPASIGPPPPVPQRYPRLADERSFGFECTHFGGAYAPEDEQRLIDGDLTFERTSFGAVTSMALQTVAGDLTFTDNGTLLNASFAALQVVEGDLTIEDNPLLTEVSFAALELVGGTLRITENELLERLDFPLLRCVNRLVITTNPALLQYELAELDYASSIEMHRSEDEGSECNVGDSADSDPRALDDATPIECPPPCDAGDCACTCSAKDDAGTTAIASCFDLGT